MQWSELRMAGCLRAVVAISVLLLSACATLPRNPVPAQYTPMATIPGMPDVRGWAGVPSVDLDQDFHLSMRQESSEDFPVGSDGVIVYPYLALSGGGSNGAFGAGFLNGWTASGTRPDFEVVTGVSTGALAAPFVFLGPRWDGRLKAAYTGGQATGLLKSRGVRALVGSGVFSGLPLRQLVETGGYYVSHEAWQAAAREAGLEVISAEISHETEWAAYRTAMEAAIADWLDAHPDHADAPSVAATAHRIKMMLDFGAPYLGFGLYLFRKG